MDSSAQRRKYQMTSRWNLDWTNVQRPHSREARKYQLLLNDHQLIQDLDQAETYKYLSMEEGEGVQHHQMKVKIKKEYKQWIKLVLNSELYARNRIAAIDTLAVPVVLYSYGIINWKLNEIQDLDKMTRKQL